MVCLWCLAVGAVGAGGSDLLVELILPLLELVNLGLTLLGETSILVLFAQGGDLGGHRLELVLRSLDEGLLLIAVDLVRLGGLCHALKDDIGLGGGHASTRSAPHGGEGGIRTTSGGGDVGLGRTSTTTLVNDEGAHHAHAGIILLVNLLRQLGVGILLLGLLGGVGGVGDLLSGAGGGSVGGEGGSVGDLLGGEGSGVGDDGGGNSSVAEERQRRLVCRLHRLGGEVALLGREPDREHLGEKITLCTLRNAREGGEGAVAVEEIGSEGRERCVGGEELEHLGEVGGRLGEVGGRLGEVGGRLGEGGHLGEGGR